MGTRFPFFLIISSIAILCAGPQAQAQIPLKCDSVEESSCLLPLGSGDFQTAGDANFVASPSHYQLTDNDQYEQGILKSNFKICAKEYRLTFQADLGAIVGEAGGSGISIIEYDLDNTILTHTQLDTQFNHCSGEICSWFPKEIDGNHISIDTDLAPPEGVPNIGSLYTYSVGSVPFDLTGVGWLNVSYHYNQGTLVATVSNGVEQFEVLAEATDRLDREVTLELWGYTNSVATNVHSVRDFQIEIIQPCEDPVETALQQACPEYELEPVCPLECVRATLHGLWEEGKILYDAYDSVMEECLRSSLSAEEFQRGYTQGVTAGQTLGYQEGYTIGHAAGVAEGIASIDQEALVQAGYQNGFQDGIASVDTEAIHAAGYDEGLEAGKASIDQVALIQEGYEEGFSAGAASVDVEQIRIFGYEEGYQAGVAEAVCEEEPELQELTLTAMPCETYGRSKWRITNPNPYPVTTEWKLSHSSVSGSVVAGAEQETYFETPYLSYPGALELFVDGELHQLEESQYCRLSPRHALQRFIRAVTYRIKHRSRRR